jgi:hypothetical protein
MVSALGPRARTRALDVARASRDRSDARDRRDKIAVAFLRVDRASARVALATSAPGPTGTVAARRDRSTSPARDSSPHSTTRRRADDAAAREREKKYRRARQGERIGRAADVTATPGVTIRRRR